MAKKAEEAPAQSRDAVLKEAIKRHKYASEVWGDARRAALDDLKFVNEENAQWDSQALEMRQGRPCLTINRLPSYIDQVIGDIRQNTPSIKVRPAGDFANDDTAEIIEGIIRGIEYKSNADSVYETAAEQAVASSIGAYRILTQYVDDESFDQEIVIKRIKNQFTVTPDPEAVEPDFSDMNYCFITDTLQEADFKMQYPDVEAANFQEEAEGEEAEGWYHDGSVRVCEYFRRIRASKTIYLLTDGTITDQTPPKELIARERKTVGYQVEWRKITADTVLEGPIILDCTTIPVVMVLGKEMNVAGKVYYRSLIRNAKTPQQLYNYMRSAHAEMVALSPKVPYIVTKEQIEGNEAQWNSANTKPYPYLVVNETGGGMPQRTQPITTHPGLVNEIAQAADEIKQTTSLFDPSRGQSNGQESGRAILALQNKGDIATIVFKDNLARAIRYGGRVICEMIPKIYDTERILSIVKKDGSHKDVVVNKQNPDNGQTINSLKTGKYNVVVVTGPSYTTQRMEAAESQLQLIQAAPQLMGVIGDLVVSNFDWPGAEGIAERIKRSLPPNLTADPDAPPPPVDPMQEAMKEMALRTATLELAKKEEELAKMRTESMLNIAKAEAAEAGQQLDVYRHTLEEIKAMLATGAPQGQPQGQPPQQAMEPDMQEIMAEIQARGLVNG